MIQDDTENNGAVDSESKKSNEEHSRADTAKIVFPLEGQITHQEPIQQISK